VAVEQTEISQGLFIGKYQKTRQKKKNKTEGMMGAGGFFRNRIAPRAKVLKTPTRAGGIGQGRVFSGSTL